MSGGSSEEVPFYLINIMWPQLSAKGETPAVRSEKTREKGLLRDVFFHEKPFRITVPARLFVATVRAKVETDAHIINIGAL